MYEFRYGGGADELKGAYNTNNGNVALKRKLTYCAGRYDFFANIRQVDFILKR